MAEIFGGIVSREGLSPEYDFGDGEVSPVTKRGENAKMGAGEVSPLRPSSLNDAMDCQGRLSDQQRMLGDRSAGA